MNTHIGVDTESRLIQSLVATGAIVHNSVVIGDLLHDEEELVFGDSAYGEKGDAINEGAPKTLDLTQKKGSSRHCCVDAQGVKSVAHKRDDSRELRIHRQG